MDPKDIEKLSKVLRNQGDKLLTSQFKFILTGELLRSLNDSFSLIVDENEFVPPQTFQVTKPNNAKSNVFRELMFIYDFIQKTYILKLTKFLDDDEDDTCVMDINKFRNITTLELQRIDVRRIHGLQYLRSQLREIVAERCITNIKDLLADCGGDKTNSFTWTSLIKVDFSYNNLECVDTSFEFTPYLQHLNLSHNKIFHISALVWLPNLKFLNLSYNQLTSVPKLNSEAPRRLQVLTINANLLEDVSGIVRLDSLLELDISDNCLLDHSNLLPLCTLSSLRYLNLTGNPLSFHQKHRSATCRYLSKSAAEVQFQLDGAFLSKHEKKLAGSYENYYPLFGHRMATSTSSSRLTPSVKSSCNTPDNSSLGSANSCHNLGDIHRTPSSAQKRMRPRCVEIEESGNFVGNKPKSPSLKKLSKEGSKEHLTTKKEIEQLREQFGNDWLMNHGTNKELQKTSGNSCRELFEEFLDVSSDKDESFATTPVNYTNKSMNSTKDLTYESANDSTLYGTAMDDSTFISFKAEEEKVVLSDPEENEVQFIVVDSSSKEDLFLIVSDMSIKEKDAMSMKTLTRWGIGTLESVERPKTCTIRLTFDTIRKDKRERQYEMEAKPCQQLERMLRDYLSSKPLSEMNQTVFKCLKCNSEFSRETDDRKRRDYEIKCPYCGNKYVVEIEKTTKCETKSPKSTSFLPRFLTSSTSSSQLPSTSEDKNLSTDPRAAKDTSSINIEVKEDDVTSKTCHSFSSIESAFDSNQSVAGSSVEILSESSHLSHVSSQSSIEVLVDRKPSEERKVSLQPSLDTIEDQKKENLEDIFVESDMKKSADSLKNKPLMEGNVNLTESSSSGSVCESVVTAYEPNSRFPVEQDQASKKVSNLLFPKSSKRNEYVEAKAGPNIIQYNYDDLTNIDHRVKLHLFRDVLEENDEKLVWLVKTIIIVDDISSDGLPIPAMVVMTTKKIYFLKISGEENDDVHLWLKKFLIYAIEKIEKIKEFSEKFCLSFIFTSKTTAIHLILRDYLLFEKLKTKLITSNQIINFLEDHEREGKITRLMGADNGLKSVAVFSSCSSSVMSATDSSNSDEIQKSRMKIGSIFVFLDFIHITSSFEWICDNISEQTFSNHLIMKQPISNLVDLENLTDSSFTLNFIDELEDTLEKWKFTFESNSQIIHLLKSIDDIWQKIFCISLLSDTLLAK